MLASELLPIPGNVKHQETQALNLWAIMQMSTVWKIVFTKGVYYTDSKDFNI